MRFILLFFSCFFGLAVVSRDLFEEQKPVATESTAAMSTLDTRNVLSLLNLKAITLVDVRSPEEFRRGRIAGAINIPFTVLNGKEFEPQTLSTLGSRNIVVYCSGVGCGESILAAQKLSKLGVRVAGVYQAGMEEWSLFKLPMEVDP